MTAPTAEKKISRDDIESKLREIQGEVDDTAESAKGMAVAVGAALAVGVAVVIFLLGKRRGKRGTTIVEVRRF